VSDDVIAFVLGVLRDMNFDVEAADADSEFGPAGVDLDSLAVVELAVRIKDGYGVTLTDDDLERLAIATIGEFAAEIAERSRSLAPVEPGGAAG
jgi:acyl carrier protein